MHSRSAPARGCFKYPVSHSWLSNLRNVSVDILVNAGYSVNTTFTSDEGTMEKAELIDEVIRLQREVDQVRGQYELDVWMNLSLTIGQLKSLFFISDQGCTNPGNLAAALRVTPTNTTGIVDRLVKQGLVSRTENAEDRRMLLLRATGKGEELVATLRQRRKGHMSEALARMSVDELTGLAQGLTSLIRAGKAHAAEVRDFGSARDPAP